MDYLEIIIQGYCIDNNRKYLHDYFNREFQKAISKGYSAKEFYDGCLSVLNEWESAIYIKLVNRQNELSLMIDRANKGELDLSILKKNSLTKKEYIEILERELNTITEEDYPEQLFYLTQNKAKGLIHFSHIQHLKECIKTAFIKSIGSYNDFKELFRDAVTYDAITDIDLSPEKKALYLVNLTLYNLEFNLWLKEIKGWEYGNELQYYEHLNRETFLEFLKNQKEQSQQTQNEFESIKQSWAKNEREDPLKIGYNRDNSIKFRGKKLYFPFDCHNLFLTITNLRNIVIDKNVCSADLAEYPQIIFENTDLKKHRELAAWIYNIIESWVTEYEVNIHNGNKTRLFDSFLKECETRVKNPIQTETPQSELSLTEQETIEPIPVLKPEAVQVVFEIIKDFFSTEQQPELKKVIETGNIASKKLLFKGPGNRLTDTFKKLIEHDFITGCQKQDLINWIISNFTFTHQNKVKAFIYDTVEKTISRNDNPCKSPLISIVNSQIQKVEPPRAKKYNKY